MNTYYIDGKNLSIEDIHQVSHAQPGEIQVELKENSVHKIRKSREYVNQIVQSDRTVYGINTGFGALSNKKIPKEQLTKLQYNLIRSHCTGVGEPFFTNTTRAIMLIRANCLAQGHSGVSLECVERILDFINHHITPLVPKKGSVGASGDLAPLAHIALCLIGEGEVLYKGKIMSSLEALKDIGKKPVELKAKDGLALINGTAVMCALGSLGLHRAKNLMKTADIIASLTLEAVRGTASAFDPKISELKPHPGQLAVSQNLNALLLESEILNSHHNCEKVQDPYSLRCIPQVHGACRQTLDHVENVFNIENNAVTDNPLIFPESDAIVSGGNFHGEPLALAMDYLSMGVAEMCSISERRVEKMMNPSFSDLPAFLTPNSGLNSGLMIAQVTSAALASENKVLAHPSSVDSIPTSTDKEDHVSMGVMSGRKLLEIIDNLHYCLAIELLCAYQGISFHTPLKSSPPLQKVVDYLKEFIEPIQEDRVFSKDINIIHGLIEKNQILKTVESSISIQ